MAGSNGPENYVANMDEGLRLLQAGMKHDTGKPMMNLISPIALTFLAEVLTFGARKYAANNWRKGILMSKLIAASMRHLTAIADGEDYDSESGLPHAAHLMCEAMFMCEQLVSERHKEFDDRFFPDPQSKDLLAALLAGDVKSVQEQLSALSIHKHSI